MGDIVILRKYGSAYWLGPGPCLMCAPLSADTGEPILADECAVDFDNAFDETDPEDAAIKRELLALLADLLGGETA